MTLTLVLVMLAQAEEVPPPMTEAPPRESQPVAPALEPAHQPEPEPVRADPGWARTGGFIGVGLAFVPFGLTVGSIVALWVNPKNTTAQDWMTVGVGLTALLAALVPTLAARSAVVPDEDAHKPRALRIIGWVMVIYGALSMFGGVAISKLVQWVIDSARITVPNEYSPIGKVIGSFTTGFDGLLCTAGVILLSMGSVMAGDRAAPAVVPTAVVLPLPGGGLAVSGGLSGRW